MVLPSCSVSCSPRTPTQALDLSYNKLFGEVPKFLYTQAPEALLNCSCELSVNLTNNSLYCPTSDTLAGYKLNNDTANALDYLNITCELPDEEDRPVSGCALACQLWLSMLFRYLHTCHILC